MDESAHRDTHRQVHCTPTYMLRLIRNHRHSDTPIQRINEGAGTEADRLKVTPLQHKRHGREQTRSTQKREDTDIQTKRSKQRAYKRPLGGKQGATEKDFSIRVFQTRYPCPLDIHPIFPNTQDSWHIPFQTLGKTTGGDFNNSQFPQHACSPVLLVPS
ncbi:unnamed protein product [Rangifer tarandus platyrhynchus]|uniref:Uncharacterized protein n=1 Tax=Rangifer tarandus platyrhynchus TaxID=3082113 RepID=A0AC59ZKJ3_RANTA